VVSGGQCRPISIRYGSVAIADVKRSFDANAGTREDVRVTDTTTTTTTTVDHPYAAAIDREHERFDELLMLIAGLDAEQRERPGYFADDHWSVKDLVAHLGAWMAEAQVQLLQIEAGTYDDAPLDVDALNAQFLAALRDQPWATCWNQLLAARAMMLSVWARLPVRTDAADRWVRKSGADHLDEHLPRLRVWVTELAA
jgi:hypothetical protein